MSLAELTLGHRRPVRIAQTLRNWAALARQRRALAQLDDTALHDLGIDRKAAETEAGRPFWDAPDNWYNRN